MNSEWQYHDEVPKSGNRLALLSLSEIEQYKRILVNFLKKKNVTTNYPESFNIHCTESDIDEIIMQLNNFDISVNSNGLSNINCELNKCFTDQGWRDIRKRLSQAKKRKQINHLVLSKALLKKLNEIRIEKKFDSIEQLLEDWIDEERVD